MRQGVRLALLGLTLSLAAGVGIASEVVAATPGPARIDMRSGSPVRLQVRVAYEHDSAKEQFAVPAERDPWQDDGRALYALFGAEWGERRTVVVRLDEDGPPRFLIDLDRDGDLRDDQPLAGVPDAGFGGGHRLPVHLPDSNVSLLLHLGKTRDGRPRLFVMAEALRDGLVTLGDEQVRFAVQGRFGKYGEQGLDVFFDTDGDGAIDYDGDSDERYMIGDEYVNLAGRSWSFGVSPNGDRLLLEALEKKRPDRYRLAPGNRAPDISFVDVDGESGRLSDYRGKVLVLYLWATWCGPCRGETPHLIEAFETYYERGLEILAVAKRDSAETVQAYVKQHKVPWRQTVDPAEGPIVTLYRATAVPNMLVIDRDGYIVERTLRGDKLMETLAPLFPEPVPAP